MLLLKLDIKFVAGTFSFIEHYYIYYALDDRDCELAHTLNSLVRVSRRVGHICAAVIASCSIHLHTVCTYANTCIVNCIGKPSSCFRFRTSALAQQRPRSPKPQLITSCVCISRAEHVSPHVLQDTSVSVQVYPVMRRASTGRTCVLVTISHHTHTVRCIA